LTSPENSGTCSTPISAALAETMSSAVPQSAFDSFTGSVLTPSTGQNEGDKSPESASSRPVFARTWAAASSTICSRGISSTAAITATTTRPRKANRIFRARRM